MDTSTNTQSAAEQAVLEEARKVNEERMAAVERLAAVVAERIELDEQLKENTKAERRAVREAEKAGWTSAQIKRFMKPPRTQTTTRNTSGTELNPPVESGGIGNG